jgi:hypothetical protein
MKRGKGREREQEKRKKKEETDHHLSKREKVHVQSGVGCRLPELRKR